MTVAWDTKRGKRWPSIAYAVPCPTCNVFIGRACLGIPEDACHIERIVRAKALGFVMVKPLPLFRDEKRP